MLLWEPVACNTRYAYRYRICTSMHACMACKLKILMHWKIVIPWLLPVIDRCSQGFREHLLDILGWPNAPFLECGGTSLALFSPFDMWNWQVQQASHMYRVVVDEAFDDFRRSCQDGDMTSILATGVDEANFIVVSWFEETWSYSSRYSTR